jgi:hypothetical protein
MVNNIAKLFYITIVAFIGVFSCNSKNKHGKIALTSYKLICNPNLKIKNDNFVSRLADFQNNKKTHDKQYLNTISNIFITELDSQNQKIVINSYIPKVSPLCYTKYDSNFYFIYIGTRYLIQKKDTDYLKKVLSKIGGKENYNLNHSMKSTNEDLVFSFELVVAKDSSWWNGARQNPGVYDSYVDKDDLMNNLKRK